MRDHPPTTRIPRRAGFTLVEILVVVSIIGVLIALLIPAVQASRESARRTHCTNNMRQIGIAMHNYLAAMKTFPPGYVSDVTKTNDDAGPGWAWGTFLLAHFEETEAFRLVNFSKSVADATMKEVREDSIETFLCPSDSGLQAIIDIPYSHGHGVICQMASASYVANAGTIRPTCKVCRDNFDGVFGRNRAIQPAELGDGLSKTLAAGERSTRWANAALWGVVPDSALPDNMNPGRFAGGPAYVLGTTFNQGFNIENGEIDAHMIDSLAESFGSSHSAGCNFLFCDGSARFIRDSINPAVLNALSTRDSRPHSGKEVVIHDSPF
jgi:prepilin-type N-terminal cleavage/methylation domain-containing protein/prepilin-type processing-associated H-X9-DG protein